MHKMRCLALALALAVLNGCERDSAPAPAAQKGDKPNLPTQAQPRLPTVKLWMGNQEVVAELANTYDQVRTGMMFRTNMAENETMLFNLHVTAPTHFWMPNCPLPLSVAYINPEGVIEEIHNLQPFDTNPVYSVSSNIRFALETRQGWFQRHGIGPGVMMRTERGTLEATFGSRQ
jgi:uncharacterized protein